MTKRVHQMGEQETIEHIINSLYLYVDKFPEQTPSLIKFLKDFLEDIEDENSVEEENSSEDDYGE